LIGYEEILHQNCTAVVSKFAVKLLWKHKGDCVISSTLFKFVITSFSERLYLYIICNCLNIHLKCRLNTKRFEKVHKKHSYQRCNSTYQRCNSTEKVHEKHSYQTHCVRTFDAVLRNNLHQFLWDAHFHPTILSHRFKCLMLFTNLHFSSIIQRSCMETKCSSCPWIVSVFASHQYCFCVVKICGHCVNTKHKKVRSAGKVFCSSRLDTYYQRLCDALLYGHPFSVLLRMTIRLWWG